MADSIITFQQKYKSKGLSQEVMVFKLIFLLVVRLFLADRRTICGKEGSKWLNMLSIDIRTAGRLHIFRHRLKTHLYHGH